MSGVSLEVPARNNVEIGAIAAQIRQAFRWTDDKFPIVEAVELGLPQIWSDFEFQVAEYRDMPGEHGLTYPDEKRIVIREDVYEGALAGQGRDRFTVAHELGHLLMHSGLGLARHVRKGDVPAYRDSEWQANSFAGALLVPRAAVVPGRSAQQVAERCGVSCDAAGVMMRKYAQQK